MVAHSRGYTTRSTSGVPIANTDLRNAMLCGFLRSLVGVYRHWWLVHQNFGFPCQLGVVLVPVACEKHLDRNDPYLVSLYVVIAGHRRALDRAVWEMTTNQTESLRAEGESKPVFLISVNTKGRFVPPVV